MFPRPERLAGATPEEIGRCGTGYRSGFVRDAARMVASGRIDLQELRDMDYEHARDAVCTVPGVGYQVADCVMLFSLEKPEAFPIDRWTTRILREHYPGRFSLDTKTITQMQYRRIHEEIVDYFGPYAGYAQQFLFKMKRERLAEDGCRHGSGRFHACCHVPADSACRSDCMTVSVRIRQFHTRVGSCQRLVPVHLCKPHTEVDHSKEDHKRKGLCND